MKIVKNIRTGEEIVKPQPVNMEVLFEGGVMISETDTAGIITYANRKFREMTGYSKDELIGSPHNINRHPDMPKAAFKQMWETIKKGEMWEGYVKNMRKDGKYYWVIVWIKPKFDENGNIVGYIAGRKVPERNMIKKIEEKYRHMRKNEI
ncbi:PAS domain-containing protein [Nitrosophilus alvini]|uniref:PAS domain-containing protein n=1 Tax=Nitrosophilus alvini TaxID=2714855 RepID=UPI00190BB2B1|nr:PAS domain-containing protein [Nitrosophilus alvini]